MRKLVLLALLSAGCNEILGLDEGHCGTCAEGLSECRAGFCAEPDQLCEGLSTYLVAARDCACNLCITNAGVCSVAECQGMMTEPCHSCFVDHLVVSDCQPMTSTCESQ